MAKGIEISKRLVLINSVSTIVDRAINIGLVLWIHQYLIKRVSPEEYEIYPVLMPVMAVVPVLMGVLIGGLGRFVIEAYARDDQRRVTQVVSTMVPICAAGALTILGFGLLVAWYVDVLLKIDPQYTWDARAMLGILVFNIALRMGLAPYKLGISVRQKFVWAHLIGLGSQLLRLTVLFLLLFGVSTRVLWVVVATVPSTVLEQIVTCTISRRLIPALRFDRKEIRPELIRPIVSLGGWGMVSRVAVVLRELATMVLLKRNAPATEVGAFGLGMMVDQRLRSSAVLPLSTAGPALTAMHATRQEERLRNSYFRLGRYLLWVFSLAIIPALVYRRELWSLYIGPEFQTYETVVPVSMYLLGRIFFLAPVPALAMIAVSRGRTRPMGLAALTVESLNFVFVAGAILYWRTGAVGISLALFCVGAVVYPLVHWRIGLAMTGARFSDWARSTLVRGLLPGLVALPVWALAQRMSPPESWLAAGTHFALGALAFLAVVGIVLEPGERKDVRTAAARVRRLFSRGQATP